MQVKEWHYIIHVVINSCCVLKFVCELCTLYTFVDHSLSRLRICTRLRLLLLFSTVRQLVRMMLVIVIIITLSSCPVSPDDLVRNANLLHLFSLKIPVFLHHFHVSQNVCSSDKTQSFASGK